MGNRKTEKRRIYKKRKEEKRLVCGVSIRFFLVWKFLLKQGFILLF